MIIKFTYTYFTKLKEFDDKMEENVKGETLIFLGFFISCSTMPPLIENDQEDTLVVNTSHFLIFGHYTFGV